MNNYPYGHAVERSDGAIYHSLGEAARTMQRERGLPRRSTWEGSGQSNLAYRIALACKSGKKLLGYQWKRRPDLDKRKQETRQ
jgi:hypothetical protein